jgi:hypothetical protein
VTRLASNPLLTIIALIHYRGKKLTNKCIELCDISTETFLEHLAGELDLKKYIFSIPAGRKFSGWLPRKYVFPSRDKRGAARPLSL